MAQTDRTLADILQEWASSRAERTLFSFPSEGDSPDLSLTCGGLDRLARSVAVQLQDAGAAGKPVLLLFPPGLDFIGAFLGCLYCGAIAVPSYPPPPSRKDRSAGSRLASIIEDVAPEFLLTTPALHPRVAMLFEETPVAYKPRILLLDCAAEDAGASWNKPDIFLKDTAFLQYTSGTTGRPKGVIISHGNLLHNLGLIHDALSITDEDSGVSWLPPYHDMGLIGGLMQPVYEGSPVTLLSPVAFLQRPFRWLDTISNTRATISAGPNFAYELCVRKITDEQKAQLDLSCWRAALNGAEPIRPTTLRSFTEAFAGCGFSPDAWSPSYGMAESTLYVCGGPAGTRPIAGRFDQSALEENRAVAVKDGADACEIVSCGEPPAGVHVVIADPELGSSCREGTVGEIWVRGASVGQGYWNNELQTAGAFRALLSGNDDGPYLKTGDLGFLYGGELYVTGRLDDLIVWEGRRITPQQLEHSVEASHPALREGASAAFTTGEFGNQGVYVVCEVEREAMVSLDTDATFTAIRHRVQIDHQTDLSGIVLIKMATIPKTSSGKIRRHACRNLYVAGTLDSIALFHTVPKADACLQE